MAANEWFCYYTKLNKLIPWLGCWSKHWSLEGYHFQKEVDIVKDGETVYLLPSLSNECESDDFVDYYQHHEVIVDLRSDDSNEKYEENQYPYDDEE